MSKLICTAAVFGLAMAGAANATIFNEVGDATDLQPGQNVANGTTGISGLVDGGLDVDLYAFAWGGGALVIDSVGATWDTQLHLFDFAGNGIGENDDSVASSPQSEIALNLAAGFYLIGISAFNNDAIDAAALPVFGFSNTFSDDNGNFIQGPEGNGPLAGWDGANFNEGGDYRINFSVPVDAIPTPGAAGLLGLAGLAAVRRRR